MFELISGRPPHPFHKPSAAPVVVSIVGHVVVVSLVLFLPLLYANDAIPNVPTMMAFVAAEPAPPPPPPPPPPPVRTVAAKAEPSQPQPVRSGEFAAPVEAPADVRPEPPGATDYGGEDGVEGGIEDGIAGGIVGGLVAAPPLPPPPPPPPPAPKAPVRSGGAVHAPALVKRVEPLYPNVALMAKLGGMVILEAMVNVDGTVESVRILRSVKLLDQAALDAVNQWRYSPLVLNGVPTPFILTVMLDFRTEEK